MKRILVCALLVFSVLACEKGDEPAPIGALPSKDAFIQDGVSEFMEKRCGSLDCHGQFGRPLRIYSEWGLRLQDGADGQHDQRATTPEEREQNYIAVVGLEPDLLADSAATGSTDFQLLKKPIDSSGGGINHKGGPVLRPTDTDPGWRCLRGWIDGVPAPDRCAEAIKIDP